MKLSILDQAVVPKNTDASEALHNAVELAIVGEELGYERIWLAEHHNNEGIASSAPEITMAHIAAKTKRIHVGSGGTMVMHYAPYKLAETFKTLSALSPGRVDFGAGRAPGGDHYSTMALSEGRPPAYDSAYTKIREALALMNDQMPENPLYHNAFAVPLNVTLPTAWLLGSTGDSAYQAGRMGLGYSYAQFFTGKMEPDVFKRYRESFSPSYFMEKPNIIVCYMITVAETIEEAEYEALPADISRLNLMRGRLEQRLSPEEAQNYPLTERDRLAISENRKAHLVGTPAMIKDMLEAEQDLHGFDEAMILCPPYAQSKRLEMYRLLADTFITQ